MATRRRSTTPAMCPSRRTGPRHVRRQGRASIVERAVDRCSSSILLSLWCSLSVSNSLTHSRRAPIELIYSSNKREPALLVLRGAFSVYKHCFNMYFYLSMHVTLQSDIKRYDHEEEMLRGQHVDKSKSLLSLAHCPYKPIVFDTSLCALLRDSDVSRDKIPMRRPIFGVRHLNYSHWRRYTDTVFHANDYRTCMPIVERVSADSKVILDIVIGSLCSF